MSPGGCGWLEAERPNDGTADCITGNDAGNDND